MKIFLPSSFSTRRSRARARRSSSFTSPASSSATSSTKLTLQRLRGTTSAGYHQLQPVTSPSPYLSPTTSSWPYAYSVSSKSLSGRHSYYRLMLIQLQLREGPVDFDINSQSAGIHDFNLYSFWSDPNHFCHHCLDLVQNFRKGLWYRVQCRAISRHDEQRDTVQGNLLF